eukprot:scaffold4911_cov47-Cyclotella_meneghiniana.AAC.6
MNLWCFGVSYRSLIGSSLSRGIRHLAILRQSSITVVGSETNGKGKKSNLNALLHASLHFLSTNKIVGNEKQDEGDEEKNGEKEAQSLFDCLRIDKHVNHVNKKIRDTQSDSLSTWELIQFVFVRIRVVDDLLMTKIRLGWEDGSCAPPTTEYLAMQQHGNAAELTGFGFYFS